MTPWQVSHVQNVLGPTPSSPWSTELPRTHLSSLGSRRRKKRSWEHLQPALTPPWEHQHGLRSVWGHTSHRVHADQKGSLNPTHWHLGQVTRHPPTYASFPLSYQHMTLDLSPQTCPRPERASHQPPWPCRRQEEQVECVLALFPLTPWDQGTEEGALGFP